MDKFLPKYLLAPIILFMVVGVFYWNVISGLAGRWMLEPDYSHCFLVPVFSIFLLFHRRKQRPQSLARGSWWGVILLGLALAIRVTGTFRHEPLVEAFSIIPFLAGSTLTLGGLSCLRWAWPSILFLIFMIPIPGTFASLLNHPLQRIATEAGTYALQTFGIAAVSQGNVILLTNGQLGVAEACAGLRMLNLFVAFCVGASLIIERPTIDKAILTVSAVAIGIAANVVRITATGIVYEKISPEMATKVFHDFAGLLLMPTAVILIAVELWVITHAFPTDSHEDLQLPVLKPMQD